MIKKVNKNKEDVEYEVVDKFTIDNCHYIIKQPTHEPTDKEMNDLCLTLVKAIYG